MALDKSTHEEFIDPKKLIALEEELHALKKEHGLEEKPSLLTALIDRVLLLTEREKVLVDRKKYIRLALSCGWLCGAHRFYTRQPVLGVLYLLFFWTGVPLAMTLIDLMIVLPMQPDEAGAVYL